MQSALALHPASLPYLNMERVFMTFVSFMGTLLLSMAMMFVVSKLVEITINWIDTLMKPKARPRD